MVVTSSHTPVDLATAQRVRDQSTSDSMRLDDRVAKRAGDGNQVAKRNGGPAIHAVTNLGHVDVWRGG
jgi:hypothetical protein